MKAKKYLNSIRAKLFIVYAGSLMMLIVIFMLLNNFFLSVYYVRDSEKSLINHYNTIEELEDIEDIGSYLHDLIRSQGIQSMILDEENEIIYETMAFNVMNSGKSKKNAGTMNGTMSNRMMPSGNMGNSETDDTQLEQPILARTVPVHIRHLIADVELIDRGYISSVETTEDNDQEVVLIGKISDDMHLVMYTSVDILNENARVANKFFLYVGIFIIIIGGIFILFFSKKITSPIIQLNNITKKIANQDFSEKFVGDSSDEVGQLGANINIMSERLSKAMETIMRANESLKDDIEKKEAINRMREEFIANVSHELKTPIGIIKGYVEGLRYEVPDTIEEKERYFEVIISESDKMSKMVMELLDLSSLESEATMLSKMVFNLSVLLDEIIEKFTPIFVDREIELTLDITDDYFVEADYMKMEQVISNYINNALNHVDERKQIKISAKRVDGNVSVNVFNTGKHIDEKVIGNIWTSFYKVDKARTRKYGGTGLGLSIVRAIVEKHNGSYGVLNKENGVEFNFEIKEYEEINF